MSDLALNDQLSLFKEFCGRNNEQMPKLVGEGRTPRFRHDRTSLAAY